MEVIKSASSSHHSNHQILTVWHESFRNCETLTKWINVGGWGNDFRMWWWGGGGGGPCCPPTPPCLVGFPPGCSAQISSSVPTTPQRGSAYRPIGVIRCFRISSTSLISWQKTRLHCGVRRGQKIFFMMHPNPCSASAVIVALHAGNHCDFICYCRHPQDCTDHSGVRKTKAKSTNVLLCIGIPAEGSDFLNTGDWVYGG